MDGEAWSISSCADRDGVREDKSNLLFSYRGAGLKTGTRTACFGFGLAAWPWRARAGCGVFVMLMLVIICTCKRTEAKASKPTLQR
jgi:hypothetical protein